MFDVICPNRSHYNSDLATIYTETDLFNVDMHTSDTWIGLHLTTSNDSTVWGWSNERETVFALITWAQDEPSPNDDCAYVPSTAYW